MSLLWIVVPSAVVLTVAYLTYGRLLSRLFQLDPRKPTPAVTLRDDVDYTPTEPKFLLSQHFSAIAAAGPIVGPIAAGMMFGWVPALAWILVGSIFIGGVHDFAALVASIRHRASSIAEVVRDHMSPRAFVLFLSFVWIALVYIIVAFTDVTVQAFVGPQPLGDGTVVAGGAIATSSLLYLLLPVAMGLLLRYTKLSLNLATLIFLPLVGLTIWAGPLIPFDVDQLLGLTRSQAVRAWDVFIILYCVVAAVVPVWLLLQPRGHLGGYFLYVALVGGMLGLVVGDVQGKFAVEYPAFTAWTFTPRPGETQTLVPFLFITIACGACSGFHSLIASGTTSKQLRVETDARPIGYGAMLMEAMVAIMSLACVMILAQGSDGLTGKPNTIYARGLGSFLGALSVPEKFAVAFSLMAFNTFVYDTLDVCSRLGRYIIQELTGWRDLKGKVLGTALTAGVPLYFLLRPGEVVNGQEVPLWLKFWSLFGASNQLLAALTLLGVTVWLWQTRRAWWVWLVTGLPCLWMYTVTTWALTVMTWPKFFDANGQFKAPTDPVPWVGVVLLVLAAILLFEGILAIRGRRRAPPPGGTPELAAGAAA